MWCKLQYYVIATNSYKRWKNLVFFYHLTSLQLNCLFRPIIKGKNDKYRLNKNFLLSRSMNFNVCYTSRVSHEKYCCFVVVVIVRRTFFRCYVVRWKAAYNYKLFICCVFSIVDIFLLLLLLFLFSCVFRCILVCHIFSPFYNFFPSWTKYTSKFESR